MKLAAATLFAALASSAWAAVSVTNPSSQSWWVENSVNLLSWTCQDPAKLSQYTVIVYHPGTLQDGLPIISLLNNFDCSESIPPNGNLPAGTNYTIGLANPQNRTDVVAISEPFEIKPFGSTYPSSASPTATPTVSATNNGSTSTGTSTSATSSKPSKGAATGPLGASSAIISGIAFVLGALLA